MNRELHDTNTTAEVSFWGKSIIKIQTLNSAPLEFSLDNIAKKILEIAANHSFGKKSNQSHLNWQQEQTGIQIVNKLIQFYDLTDEKVKTANFITRFFYWIRNRIAEDLDQIPFLRALNGERISKRPYFRDKLYLYGEDWFSKLSEEENAKRRKEVYVNFLDALIAIEQVGQILANNGNRN